MHAYLNINIHIHSGTLEVRKISSLVMTPSAILVLMARPTFSSDKYRWAISKCR